MGNGRRVGDLAEGGAAWRPTFSAPTLDPFGTVGQRDDPVCPAVDMAGFTNRDLHAFPLSPRQARSRGGRFQICLLGTSRIWGSTSRIATIRRALPMALNVACERISMREDRGPQLSVPIDAELKARVEAAAAREDRPVASFVRRIVMKALDGEREGAAA